MQFSQVFERNILFISQHIKHLFNQTTKESFIKYINAFTDCWDLQTAEIIFKEENKSIANSYIQIICNMLKRI